MNQHEQASRETLDPRQKALNDITARLLVVIVLPLVLMLFIAYIVIGNGDPGVTSGADKESNDGHSYLMLITFVVGVLGGFISVQQRIPKASLKELQALASSWASLFIMPVTGGVFALVIFIMFAGKLLSGALFPEFTYQEFNAEMNDTAKMQVTLFGIFPATPVDLIKLVFWAFVAGFLERFVPRLLRTTANAAQRDAENTLEDDDTVVQQGKVQETRDSTVKPFNK